ncbi:MAG: prepilin-type N-terminal cleavage/methylation domain-containing protein [Verrucomicrobiales bacterium]|nr:prepilin-type N-terminal cleavage/methylation domain-containing protein [Verrucomicrobiales bacterium]
MGPRRVGPGSDAPVAAGSRAFTLAELLVVIVIIGVLAAIGLPALRGLGESNAIDAATRQMLDDLAFARLKAINDRTTVYMVFVPPGIESMVAHLAPYRYTGYTLFSRRSIGDQPGRQTPRQLIPWRNLPDKTFFPVTKLLNAPVPTTNLYEQPFAFTNNFTLTVTNRVYTNLFMRYIAFNAEGQLVRIDNRGNQLIGNDEYVALSKGSVVHPQDANGTYLNEDADLVEIPPGNRRFIKVNWLTGRAEVLGDLIASGSEWRIEGQPR